MSDLKINLTYARPGEGKTADLARTILKLFDGYYATEKKYPQLPKRIMMCNLKLSAKIEHNQLFSHPGSKQHLYYWDDLRQLRYCPRLKCWRNNDQKDDDGLQRHASHDADVIIDEINNYVPADGFKDLPRWCRKFFAQHRHRGIRIFATTQDYRAVDINFRRMVGHAFKVERWFGTRDITATLPPPRMVFVWCWKREYHPDDLEAYGIYSDGLLEAEIRSPFQFWPRMFFITRRLVDVYDTTQDLKEWRPNELEHLEYSCRVCGKIHVTHSKQ